MTFDIVTIKVVLRTVNKHILTYLKFKNRAGSWWYPSTLQISDASGSMKVSVVAPSSPFKQAMLSPEECYILDNGVDRNIFVWKGTNMITDSITQQKMVLCNLLTLAFSFPLHRFFMLNTWKQLFGPDSIYIL